MNAKDAASPAKPGRPMLAMTVEEAAGGLRASPKTVMEAIRRRELSARKLGRSWRISPKALEDWLCRPEPLSPEEAGRQRALEEFRTGWHDLNAFLGRHEIPAGVFCFALEADDGSYCPVMPNGERWPLRAWPDWSAFEAAREGRRAWIIKIPGQERWETEKEDAGDAGRQDSPSLEILAFQTGSGRAFEWKAGEAAPPDMDSVRSWPSSLDFFSGHEEGARPDRGLFVLLPERP
ncbi:MAG: helix-turn-helix domain-containing protein [Desulfovibrio sp.]|nr:helix-turn-helix domain-containing protein [Desulfovibrio sp.]